MIFSYSGMFIHKNNKGVDLKMITIIYGENTVQSRKKLVDLLDSAKSQDQEVVRLEAKKLTEADLESALQAKSLFGNEQLVIIEGLHSLPRSKRKTNLIELAASSQIPLILWEKRSLTATMLKKFPQAKTLEFKLMNALFAWLDSLDGNQSKTAQLRKFHQALQSTDPHMCFVMLIRQVRLLIQTLDGGNIKGPPFMISKLKKQAQTFTLDRLLDVHHQLAVIDQQMKTSKLMLPLEKQLDLVVLNM